MSATNTANGQKVTPPLNNPAYPLISVIVLTYRDQGALFQTLDTILKQDYPNIELIVSDDSSGVQNRRQIIDYIDQNRSRNLIDYKILCNESNMGTVVHANSTARLSTGEFIKFLPCGDGFIGTSSLKALYQFAKEYGEPVVTSVSAVSSTDFSRIYYHYPSKRRVEILRNTPPQALYPKLAVSNIISAVSALFRRRFFLEGGFDEGFRYLEDWPLWLKLSRSNVLIPCLDVATVFYALGGISSENGNAFSSSLLRNDMIRCYEYEILPNIKNLSVTGRYCARYDYGRLTNRNRSPLQKTGFVLLYLPFVVYGLLKKLLKYLSIKVKEAGH